MRGYRGIAIRARSCVHAALAAGIPLLTACEVERTPERYFDQRGRVEAERLAAAAEVRDRLLALGGALGRGSTTEAMIALAPAEDAYLVGPRQGDVVVGPEPIGIALESLTSGASAVELRDVHVTIGPRTSVAWFRGRLHAPGAGEDSTALRVTGVYLRDAGLWRLVQAHLSRAVTPPPSPEAPAADSAANE